MEKDRKTWRPTRTVRRNRGYLKVPGRVRIFGHTGYCMTLRVMNITEPGLESRTRFATWS